MRIYSGSLKKLRTSVPFSRKKPPSLSRASPSGMLLKSSSQKRLIFSPLALAMMLVQAISRPACRASHSSRDARQSETISQWLISCHLMVMRVRSFWEIFSSGSLSISSWSQVRYSLSPSRAMRSPRARSSSSLCLSASSSMRSMSSGLRRPLSFLIWIFDLLFCRTSSALTSRMPFESRAKVTQILGTPRRDFGMPMSVNLPRKLLSDTLARSPS
mmetsp:Transcript_61682/g.138974  ORF Transcript_61682/g.138974 Transcript_61682/m.138974 type:complete len:216 (-) Transcript_61682:911-1558(-)